MSSSLGSRVSRWLLALGAVMVLAAVLPMLNTLVQRNCGMILATGSASSQVLAAAKANPHQHFLLVTAPGTAAAAATSNTVVVSQADAAGRIGQVLRSLAASAPPPGS